MSPYIITTTRALDSNPHTRLVSRRAVATLEEDGDGELRVRNAGDRFSVDYRSNYGQPWVLVAGPFDSARVSNDVKHAIQALPESGGPVGPLPDGTVLEVESVSPLMLSARIPGDKAGLGALVRSCLDTDDWAPLIATFNARHS